MIDEYLNRDTSGVFQSSTRVSAVVFVGYDEDHEFMRKVFPNPKAKNPLCEEEKKIIEGIEVQSNPIQSNPNGELQITN